MSNKRKTPNANAQQLLFAQVGGICPICADPLVYTKSGISQYQKNYELAHIYPLNPTKEEEQLLADEPRLSDDVNSIDNFIPLCLKCHNRFDNPRTDEEYRKLYALKKQLIDEENAKNLFSQYTIAEEIQTIILTLLQVDLGSAEEKLELTALQIDQKLKNDFNPITKRHIVADVTDYYPLIRRLFSSIERDTPGKFNVIAANVHAFYLNLKLKVTTQEEIYNEMAKWLYIKTKQGSLDACKVIVAFFIQNCEVFEYVAE
ncbi:ABC-three component system protein [Desulfosporosinus sp.]|uniref:ABC-three component system protein n=1 Tax=Desulfosporosinus sp. TaxID=157907 RepID=UPI0025BDF577|nr:ABC-three component system protein [Desulfosporosinus sp.]MBC2726024.1 HNH endonuclease [Desulfosporosinus sp.]